MATQHIKVTYVSFIQFILTGQHTNALKNILKMCSMCNVKSDSSFDIFS